MTAVPTSRKSTITFKIDLTEWAACAKQQLVVAGGGTNVTPGTRLLWWSQSSRFKGHGARLQVKPRTQRYPLFLGVILAAIALALATGCGYSGSVLPVAIGGSIQGGHRPVSGANIELYAAGTGGPGSSSQLLLRQPVASDNNGHFTIPAEYGCPSPTAEIYVVASGGNPNVSEGQNPALTLAASLGPCSGLAKLGTVAVNEVTTVGAIWPLAKYWKSPNHLGSASGDTAFPDAISTVPEFINLTQGSSPGTPTTTSYFAENNKLYSLADVLAACVNSSGGKAGDGSPCGQLFTMATTADGNAPSDTMTAAIQIAQQPDSNVAGIYGLVDGSTVFQPALTAAPSDWTLTLSYVVATPSISLATGTYAGTQEVTITDATAGSVIYYTTDGTTPTNSSSPYTGPISVGVSSTIQALAVLSGSASAVASSTLTITGGAAPAKLAFLQQPSNGLIGATISPAVQVVVEDASGNPDTSASNPVTLALQGGAGLGGTLTVTPQNGIATFSDLMVSVAGAGYTLLATSPGLTSANSTSFAITASAPGPLPALAKLVFLQQPSNGVTGTPISPAVQVAVEDAGGNIVTTAVTPIKITLTSSKGIGSTLWTATPQNGIATFSNVTVGTAGSGYTLLASSPSLTSAASAPFTITAPGSGTPPSPFKLAFLQQPMNALAQATITPAVQVVVEDSNGNAVQGANNPITLALSGGSGLNGTLTVTPQNGVASFNDLSVSNAGTGYTLQATSPALVPAPSASFTISAPSSGNGPAPVKLAFVEQPSNALTGATISPAVQVEVEDAGGNAVLTAVSPITIALTGATGLGGTLTVSPQMGIATFSNLSVTAAGTGLTLTAASSNLLPATSTPFTISAPSGGNPPASAVKLAFLQQPSNALTGATISPAVQVVVEDANGVAVPAATNPISLTLAGGTGLGGTLTVTPQNGVATFTNLTVSTAGTGLTLLAASPNLTSATSVAFTINTPSSGPPPAPTRLAYLQQPSNAVTGADISPAVQVAVEDASGNVLPTATNPITVALAGGTGLAGTLTVVPQNGIATFSNLTVSNAGSYTLSATSPTLTAATSIGFTITAPSLPTAVKLAFSVQPSNALTQTTITPAVQVEVQDGSGNLVSNATNPVTLALAGGTGLAGTLTVIPQNGVATFSNLSISNAGSYTLSASSPSLTAATSTSFTISAPVPTAIKLAFSVQPSNALTQATITPAVQVLVEDSSGTVVTTATNPLTLALVGGTGLGGTLTVTPQNGVATFSNLSISNAGSYTLSASSPSLTPATSTGFTITAPSLPVAVKLAFSVQPSNAQTGATISPAVKVSLQDASGNTITSAINPVTLALVGGTGLGGTLTVIPQNGVATFSNLSVSNAGSYTLSASSIGLTGATSASFTVSSTASCSITSFGAVGDGVTNNASAIQNTFNYAAANNCTALIPAGTFAYSGTITARGIAVMGTGASSILKALDTNNEALTLTGNGGSISNLVMQGTGSTRTFSYQAGMIWVNGATNFTIQNVLINGGSCVGIFDAGGQTGLIQNNTVENTLADSITNTNGASGITVKGNRVINSGDDGVSNNSYLADSNTVHDIIVEGNTILHNAWGRGLEVSGGSNITFTGNYVDNLDGYTDMYIASESEYKTQNVSNITVTGNTFVDGGPNQGSAIIYNSEAGTTTITGVTINGNQFVNPKAGAVQFAGNGSETGLLIQNNTDYSTSAFSFSSNPSTPPTLTGNQVLAPSTFTTPLVSPGGGCSFAGC